MQMVGRHNFYGIQVLLLLQQFPEIGIGGARLELLRAPLVGVIGVHHCAPDFAAPGTAVVVFSPDGISQVFAYSVPDAVLAPLQVVAAIGVRITDGNDLYLGVGEQIPEFPKPLGAHADVG